MIYDPASWSTDLIGPMTTKYYHPTAKLEAVCPICPWSYFQWTEHSARSILSWHIQTTHTDPPPPIKLKPHQMPGR